MNKSATGPTDMCFCPRAPKQNDAPTYPEEFCEELVMAIKLQKQLGARGVQLIAAVQEDKKTEKEHIGNNKNEFHKAPDEEAECDTHSDIAWDDMSGKHLDPDRVKQARADESEHYNKIGVFFDPGADVGKIFRGRSRSPWGPNGWTWTKVTGTDPTIGRDWPPYITVKSGKTICTQQRRRSSHCVLCSRPRRLEPRGR